MMADAKHWRLPGPRVRLPVAAYESREREFSFAIFGVLFGRVLMGARPFEVGAY